MPTTFIAIDTTKRLGLETRNVSDALRGVIDRLRRLKEVADTCIDTAPNPDDFSLMEAQFGVAAGKGETLYNLISGAYAACNAVATRQLLDWCG